MPRGVYKREGTPDVTAETAAESKVGEPTHRTTPVHVKDRAGDGLAYMALKPMKVNGQQVRPGEIVPDAVNWRNVHNYVSTGHLAVVKQES